MGLQRPTRCSHSVPPAGTDSWVASRPAPARGLLGSHPQPDGANCVWMSPSLTLVAQTSSKICTCAPAAPHPPAHHFGALRALPEMSTLYP